MTYSCDILLIKSCWYISYSWSFISKENMFGKNCCLIIIYHYYLLLFITPTGIQTSIGQLIWRNDTGEIITVYSLGLSIHMMKRIKTKCPSLRRLEITYEQITDRFNKQPFNFFNLLPTTLTHLSLAYCNIRESQIRTLFSAGM